MSIFVNPFAVGLVALITGSIVIGIVVAFLASRNAGKNNIKHVKSDWMD